MRVLITVIRLLFVMPWTLYAYITKETLKLLGMAAAVLVVLISVAAAIKPLSEGLLDPPSLIKFVIYTSPTMLQFALPFAAAFASTLFFSRMVADNEMTACSASGMSYALVLVPIATLGLVLMLGLYVLSNSIVPRFNQAAASMVESDVIRLMVADLNKGHARKMGNMVVYADDAKERLPTPEERVESLRRGSRYEPYRVIMLRRVAVSVLGNDGEKTDVIRKEGAAQAANIFLYRDGLSTLASFYLQDPVYFDPITGDLGRGSDLTYVHRLESPLSDQPQFLSGAALKELAADPERFDRIYRLKNDLAQAMARQRLLNLIRQGVARDGPLALLGPGGELYEFNDAAAMTNDQAATPEGIASNELWLRGRGDGPVTLLAYREVEGRRRLERRFEAKQVRITARQESFDTEPQAIVELRQVTVFAGSRANAASTQHDRHTLAPLHWPTRLVDDLRQASTQTLINASEDATSTSAVVQSGVKLKDAINRLVRQIIAQMHQRANAALTALLVLILGAVLSMTLRGKPALVVYFWTFMATLLTVMLAMAGDTVCRNPQFPLAAGVTLIWLGNVLLAGLLAVTFVRLRRT